MSVDWARRRWPLSAIQDWCVDLCKERLEKSSSKAVLEECMGACECKPSSLPGGGNGLFAKRELLQGAPIAVLSQGVISVRNQGHSVLLKDGRFQAYPHPEGVRMLLRGLGVSPDTACVLGRAGCLANEAVDEAGRNAVIVEIRTQKVGLETAMTSRVLTLLICSKPIDAGSEILTDYGQGGGWHHRNYARLGGGWEHGVPGAWAKDGSPSL